MIYMHGIEGAIRTVFLSRNYCFTKLDSPKDQQAGEKQGQ